MKDIPLTKTWVLWQQVFLLACLTLSQLAGQNTCSKPNILFIMVDDMGLMDTSAPMLAEENSKPNSFLLDIDFDQLWLIC